MYITWDDSCVPSLLSHNAPSLSRQVLVRTSDVRGAGTDADVFLTVYGPKGDTGERELAASGNNFERNKVGRVVCVCLGNPIDY